MHSTVQKRVFNNYSAGLLGFVSTFLQTIILVPILLKYWGNDIYGIWIALFAGFNLLQSLDFGHQAFVGNLLNIEYHINKDKFASFLGSSILIAILLGTFQLILTLILIYSNYITDFLGITTADNVSSFISASLVILVLIWVFAGSVGGIIIKILIPAGYMTQSLIWGIILKFVQFLSILIVAIGGGKILEASIVYSAVHLLIAYLILRYIKYKMPEYFPWWSHRDIKTGFNNFKKSVVLTVNNALHQLSSNGLVLFITNVFSTAVVPAFTTVRTLTNTASVFTNLFITSIQPDLIKYHAKHEIEKLRSTFNANWFFSGVVVNLGLILIIPFAERIFQIWTRGIILFDFNLFISLAAGISVINFGAGLYNYLYGINNLKSVSIIATTRVIVLFTLSYYLSGIMGLSGIGAAVLISEIFSSIILPYLFVNRVLKSFNGKLNIKSILIALISPCILTVLAFVQLSGLAFSYFIWGSALVLIILAYILNWLYLDPEVKVRTKNLMSNLF